MSATPQRAKDLFLLALELPLDARDAYLADACGEDAVLRLEVESLLQFHDAGNAPDRDASTSDHQVVFAPGEVFAGRRSRSSTFAPSLPCPRFHRIRAVSTVVSPFAFRFRLP